MSDATGDEFENSQGASAENPRDSTVEHGSPKPQDVVLSEFDQTLDELSGETDQAEEVKASIDNNQPDSPEPFQVQVAAPEGSSEPIKLDDEQVAKIRPDLPTPSPTVNAKVQFDEALQESMPEAACATRTIRSFAERMHELLDVDNALEPIQIYDPAEWEDKIQEWEQTRILLLTSANPEILQRLAYMLRTQSGFVNYRKWEPKNLHRSEHEQNAYAPSPHTEMSFEELQRVHEHEVSKRQISILSVNRPPAFQQIKKFATSKSRSQFSQTLLRKDHYVICIIAPGMSDEGLPNGSHFTRWEFDYLPSLVIDHAKDHVCRPREVIESFLQGVGRGNWPVGSQVQNAVVTKILSEGYDRFVEEVKSRVQDDYAPVTEAPHDLEAEGSVKLGIYFAASHFENYSVEENDLSTEEFECILEIFLEGEFEEAPVQQRDDHDDLDDDFVISTDTREPALNAWRANSDKLIQDCGLRSTGTQRRYAFKDAEWGAKLRSKFAASHETYRRRQFRKIYDFGAIFWPSISERLSGKLVSIAGQLAKEYPATFAANWFPELVKGIQHWAPDVRLSTDQIRKLQLEDPSYPLDALVIQRFVAYLQVRGTPSSFFVRRFSALCWEMLSHEISQDSVPHVLESLRRLDTSNPEMALRVISKLRGAPGIDYIDWLRRIISQAKPSARLWALQLLMSSVSEEDTLEHIARQLDGWLPIDQNSEEISVVGCYALAFLFEFFKPSSKLLAWPENANDIQHPAFPAEIICNPEQQEKRFQLIEEWLLHPQLHRAVRRVTIDRILARFGEDLEKLYEAAAGEIARSTVIADVLGGWYDLASKMDGSEVAFQVEELVKRLSIQMDLGLKRDIRKYLHHKVELVRLELRLAKGMSGRNTRRDLRARGQRLQRLRSILSKSRKSISVKEIAK